MTIHSDTLFLVLAVSISLVAGFVAGAKHGRMGALFGLLGGFTAVFLIFSILRTLLPDRPLPKNRK